MKCKQAKLKIFLLSEGRLDSSDAAEVRQHISVCSSCRRELEMDGLTADLLRSVADFEPKVDGWERLQARINTEPLPGRTAAWKPALAFCVIVILAAIAFNLFGGTSNRTAPQMVRETTVSPQPEVEKQLPVADLNVSREQQPEKSVEVKEVPRTAFAPVSEPQTAKKKGVDKGYRRSVRKEPSVNKRAVPSSVGEPEKVDKPLQNEKMVKAVEDESVIDIDANPPTIQDVSSEMSDFITEGISVLVEASHELARSNMENQL